MKKSIVFSFLSLIILVLLGSCKDENPVQKKKVLIDPEKQTEFDNLISAIDASTPTDSSASLRFENEDFQRKELLLYLYENISCTKWVFEEEKKDGKKRTVTFYFNKGKLFNSNEIIFEENEVRETKSYYNEKMEGIYSSTRTAKSYLDLEKASIKPCEFVVHNFKECLNIKDAKGEYATKFLELINFEGIDFIRVGQKDNNGFWSDLIVPEMTDSIKSLGEAKSNLGKPLKISFSIKNKNGFDFQVLESISY